MSYNGSGTFQINTTGQPVVTGTVISSTAFNALTADLATGLSTAITKDGQTTTTARIIFAQGTRDNTLTASSAVATDASKNLVSVTNTGTGNNVLATSPTLVTPALGTPSSGVLTNCTGVQYTGFKNRILNGSMALDQRNAGASQTITAAAALAYTVDRWYGYCTGANVTGQQVAGANATQFRYRFTGAASVTAVGFGQRIEQKNSYDLAGSTATLSADLAISATLTTVTWTAYYATTTADTFGSLASPTVTSIATGTFTVTSTVTNFSTNISIPAAATTGIQILFTVGALTAGLTWTIGNVQLEKSSTATSFDYRSYGTELALCQRYFQLMDMGYVYGYAPSGNQISSNYTFPVAMRASPTIAVVTNPTFGSGTAVTSYQTTARMTSFYMVTNGAGYATWVGGQFSATIEL
jgi:hypothetical protein